ncbi:S9 family peptidase [Mycetocola miduiensis]|uniref:Oligopeptidase B Serine peptidase. MEROPS family S09A n=1 Tax=Mycetocola miduiensis TaxID=995034 RepID=A0A1I5BM27_9MICO|nr:S9 family peptidase [Mycetocola miduiensis]SFN75844.1 oligopeptidase B Serine peptidase. MEROPS family S09A [Mycetocola miduiensis]
MASLLPPRAATHPTERIHHGDTVIDNYEWLRDKESAEVIAHLNAENAYTEQQNAHLAGLRETIFGEIKGRTLETDLSVPVREGSWWYYGRSVEGKEYGIHCRAPIADENDWTPPALEPGVDVPGEQILLDGNVEAEGHDFFSLGSFDVSQDGELLAWAVDTEGDERFTLRVRNLVTGEDLADEIQNTSHGAVFSPDGRFVFYTTVDESWRPDTLWRHEVGTPTRADVLVLSEPDERFWVGVGVTRSSRYVQVVVSSSVTSEWLLIDGHDVTTEPRVVWPRRDDVEYSVEHAVIGGEDTLLILHNADAPNFELVAVSPDATGNGPGDAMVVRAHSDEVRLEDVEAFAGHLVFGYRRDGLSRLAIATLDGVSSPDAIDVREVGFDEPLYTVGASANPEWAQPTVRLSYGSLVTPATVYDLDVASGKLTQLKQQPVLGGYSPDDYEQAREWATADDGTRVPISLVWKRGTSRPAPLLLYGYGSYEASMDPAMSIARLSLLDRGVTFAIAHVRGGGELGRAWYENGKTLSKKNTFTDFVACARHLVDAGYTTPDAMVAEGGSAGGLLMGAVANLAPELFTGILAEVPFVDPLTSILDPDLPLTVIEWDEWGNPLKNADVYGYMKSYSPYENVRDDVEYPRILAVTSINDTRVLYVEPAKWVARLREVGAPVQFKVEMNAGHGGVSGRYNAWRERAYELAWVLDTLGLAS